MANPNGQIRAKPFRDALNLEIAADPLTVRRIAKALMARAAKGDVPSIKEFADRTDGKVVQTIAGDDEHAPIRIATDEDRSRALVRLLKSVKDKK